MVEESVVNKKAAAGRFCRFMRKACGVLLIASPIGLMVIWLNFDFFEPYMRPQLGIASNVTITVPSIFLAAIISFMRLSIGLYGLLLLRDTFAEGAAGRHFSSEAVGSFRKFAWVAIAYVVAGPFERTLIILAFTLGNPPGERILSIGLGGVDLLAFFVGLLFVAVAHMFKEGQRLAEENAEFL